MRTRVNWGHWGLWGLQEHGDIGVSRDVGVIGEIEVISGAGGHWAVAFQQPL